MHKDNKPKALTNDEINEIAQLKSIREMWGAETPEEMAEILRDNAYAVKFDFVSGGPGYVGEYYIIQGDALGENPVQIIRKDGRLLRFLSAFQEFITADKTDSDAWRCICGNTPGDNGFFPCDERGNEMEPTIGSGWADLYVCANCGRIIKQGTLEVIGQNPHPQLLA